jgi:hypothetical protein
MLKSEFIATKERNKMLIQTLEQMEQIVSKTSFLSWDGWSVIEMSPSAKGSSSIHGAFSQGKWYLKRTFTPSRQGWEIPNRYVK